MARLGHSLTRNVFLHLQDMSGASSIGNGWRTHGWQWSLQVGIMASDGSHVDMKFEASHV